MQEIEIGRQRIQLERSDVEPIRVQLHFGDKVGVADICRLLGVRRGAVTRLFDSGRLDRFAMAGCVYAPWHQVEALLREGDGSRRGRKAKSASA